MGGFNEASAFMLEKSRVLFVERDPHVTPAFLRGLVEKRFVHDRFRTSASIGSGTSRPPSR
jgi:hypothetical protein